MKPTLLTMGVMTGNSLDAVDVVITKLSPDGGIQDAQHYAGAFPSDLAEQLRAFRETLRSCDGDVARAETQLSVPLSEIHSRYIKVVGEACLATIVSARTARTIGRDTVPDLVGFHGQTCAHLPPSIARAKNLSPYTVQLGDAQALANILDIPVAYDFRSDDVMNGGEGAPFAPMHHLHLARHTKAQGTSASSPTRSARGTPLCSDGTLDPSIISPIFSLDGKRGFHTIVTERSDSQAP
jgi:anhydro-N-acetylmuramic acid kinase